MAVLSNSGRHLVSKQKSFAAYVCYSVMQTMPKAVSSKRAPVKLGCPSYPNFGYSYSYFIYKLYIHIFVETSGTTCVTGKWQDQGALQVRNWSEGIRTSWSGDLRSHLCGGLCIQYHWDINLRSLRWEVLVPLQISRGSIPMGNMPSCH